MQPKATILGAPLLSVTSGTSVVLNASASICYFGPCTTTFVVDCGNKVITRSGAGTTTTLTTGLGTSQDVDITGVAVRKCSVTATVTDANGASSTATATLQVAGRVDCTQWRLAC